MIVAGIDPGKTGALSVLYENNVVRSFDVPLVKLKGKERPAWSEWASGWATAFDMLGPDMIVIEDVSSRPAQGVTGVFSFGRTLGFAHALAARANVPVHFVTPTVWKGKLGLLNSDKNASREKARTLFPRSAELFNLVKHSDRAEAALLAYYGRKYL